MPIRQAQNARKRKTVLASGEDEARAIARQRTDQRVTRGELDAAKAASTKSLAELRAENEGITLGEFSAMLKYKRDRQEANRLGISVADLRAMRSSELVDPKGTVQGEKGRPKGPVPAGGEPTALGGEERRRRGVRRAFRTVLSDVEGGTRLGA